MVTPTTSDEATQTFWDNQAANFDDEPDHGLSEPHIRAAWQDLLLPLLPPTPARVADLGCGTGSLSWLLAEAGHVVIGVDFAHEMLLRAQAKPTTTSSRARFAQGDAGRPPLARGSFDVVLDRHVLWALPDPGGALDHWIDLLNPRGVLILIEGRWSTDTGFTSRELYDLLQQRRDHIDIESLDDTALWGRPISDDRYLAVSRS